MMTKRDKPLSSVFKTVLTISWCIIAGLFFVLAWQEFAGPVYQLGKLLQAVNWYVFALAVGVLIIGQVIRAQLSYATHLALGYPVDRGQAFRYWVFSQMGKYIPGGIWLFASRAVFYQQNGMPTLLASAAVVWETLSILVTGILIVLVSLPTLPVFDWSVIASMGAIGILIIVVTSLWQMERLWGWLDRIHLPGAASMLRLTQETKKQRPALLRRHLTLSLISWLIIGSSFYVLTLAFPPLSDVALLSANALFIASWVIGFLVLFAPGGIGSREAALTAFLVPLSSPSEALTFALIARIWWTAAEALLFLFGGGMQMVTSMRSARDISLGPTTNPLIVPSDDQLPPPFFIVGCGRSGTTLLRTMLNHHPEIAIPLESFFIVDYLRAPKTVPISRLRSMLYTEYELKEWGLNLDRNALDGYQTPGHLIQRLHELYAREHGKSMWGQKTPRLVRFGDLIKSTYPLAKFIIVLRDPRATVNSLMQSNVHNTNVLFASRRWVADVREGLTIMRKWPDDVLEVYYEDLISQPRYELQRICTFLDVPYDPTVLTYHESGLQEYSEYYAQIHARLEQSPQASRVHAWLEELQQEHIEIIEAVCGSIMEQVGYKRLGQTAHIHKDQTIRYYYIQRLLGLMSQMIYYGIHRRGYIANYVRRKINLGLFWQDIWHINY